MPIVYLLIPLIFILAGCNPGSPEITRMFIRPSSPTVSIEPGEYALGLGGLRVINGTVAWRDGILYIPRVSNRAKLLPLLIWLHGGGQKAESFRYMFALAEELDVVILALDSRHNTWDGIDSSFGPDVQFLNAALKHTFNRVLIDPRRIGLGGLSDGATYALALGRVNGDLFSHLIAVAPGHLDPPSSPLGRPKIFVAHGIRDNIYNVSWSRHFIVPPLKSAGYEVTYLEFDGPHWVPVPVVRDILEWLVH